MKALLELPFFYNLWRRGIARSDLNSVLVSTYARPANSQRVLDIGCGPAPILESLPRDVEYVGFDPNSAYIDSARARFGARGRFFRSTATREALEDLGKFDVVMAVGVLHHLDDEEAAELFWMAHEALEPGGRLITFDGCYRDGQSRVARMLLDHDRGRHVRTQDEYLALAEGAFSSVSPHLREDLLRVPYTHVILECRKDALGSGPRA